MTTYIARYRYRFYPTKAQRDMLARTFGCVRTVYNIAHRATLWALEAGEAILSLGEMSKALSALKQTEEFSWLSEVSSVPLQQSLRHLKAAWGRCFDKLARKPRFKTRRSEQSAEYTRSGFRIKAGQVYLAKMKAPLDIRFSRPLPSAPTSLTVILDRAGRYFISFVVQVAAEQLPVCAEAIGVDLGLTHFATLTTGEKINNPRFLQRQLDLLARDQRRLSKKVAGSNNRRKAAKRIARRHAKIADMRRDHLHKLSTRLVRENQVIVIEDLHVRGMVRNRRLSRAISDVGWGMFRRMLDYKARWYGRELVVIDRFYPSSKLCGMCGHKRSNIPLSVRQWSCPDCGTLHDRDLNAAHNILAAGLAVYACGDKTAGQGQQARLFAAHTSSRCVGSP